MFDQRIMEHRKKNQELQQVLAQGQKQYPQHPVLEKISEMAVDIDEKKMMNIEMVDAYIRDLLTTCLVNDKDNPKPNPYVEKAASLTRGLLVNKYEIAKIEKAKDILMHPTRASVEGTSFDSSYMKKYDELNKKLKEQEQKIFKNGYKGTYPNGEWKSNKYEDKYAVLQSVREGMKMVLNTYNKEENADAYDPGEPVRKACDNHPLFNEGRSTVSDTLKVVGLFNDLIKEKGINPAYLHESEEADTEAGNELGYK